MAGGLVLHLRVDLRGAAADEADPTAAHGATTVSGDLQSPAVHGGVADLDGL